LTTQSGWTINPSSNPTQVPPLFQRVLDEGSSGAVVTPVDASGNTTAAITFNGMGWIQPKNGDDSLPLNRVDIDSANMSGKSEIRKLRVQIYTGGVAKMCDPAVPATDTRACP